MEQDAPAAATEQLQSHRKHIQRQLTARQIKCVCGPLSFFDTGLCQKRTPLLVSHTTTSDQFCAAAVAAPAVQIAALGAMVLTTPLLLRHLSRGAHAVVAPGLLARSACWSHASAFAKQQQQQQTKPTRGGGSGTAGLSSSARTSGAASSVDALDQVVGDVLQSMRDAGTFKNERVITSPQGPSIGGSFWPFAGWHARQLGLSLHRPLQALGWLQQ